MSRTYVSPHAREIIETICAEYALQADRVAGGFLDPDKVQACLIERLNAKSIKSDAMRHFLSDVGPIPADDDTSPDREWAEDPRDDSFNEVRHGPSSPTGIKRNAKVVEDELDHPMPGERIC